MVYVKKSKPYHAEPDTVEAVTVEAPIITPGAVMVTWLGEDDQHEDGEGPTVNTWRNLTFIKGEPLEVSDPEMIAKARVNRFYSVEG